MREQILTDHERKIIKTYWETNEKLPGFRTLLFRARKVKTTLDEDQVQIKRLLEKAGAEKPKKP